METSQPRWVSAESLYATHRLNRNLVYSLLKTGKLRGRKMGRLTLISYESADKYIETLPAYTAPEKSAA